MTAFVRHARLMGLLGLLIAVVGMAACGPAGPTPTGPVPSADGQTPPAAASGTPSDAPSNGPGIVELQVYAAASLKNVLAELAAAYTASNPGTTFAMSTDSSAALATKIEEGAPADVFLSADLASPQRLVDAGLAPDGVTIFAGNELALIVPAANTAGVFAPGDLARDGVKVIAAADGVPIAGYTREMLENLARLDTYPEDFVALVEANVVSREDNVGGIVTKVSLGEGDAGIVYLTDAKAAEGVRAISIPAEYNVSASYGAVALGDAPDAAAAGAFVTWLSSAEAQDILAAHGFKPVA
jgi:molybdate transport system substrate-binding protein